MRKYESPVVIANSDLSEGVYTASGATTDNYTATYFGWENGYKKYNLSITKVKSEEVSAVVEKYGKVTEVSGLYSATCTDNGDGTVTVLYTGTTNLPIGDKISTIIVGVKGTGEKYGIR